VKVWLFRELAIQVGNFIRGLRQSEHEFKVVTVYGGEHIKIQLENLKNGVDIIVGTPGRLIDLINKQVISFC
jgi:superfamily II DNA/RNA helicase